MTGKLLKYEFKSAVRQIGVVWAALIAMAIILGIMGIIFDSVFGDHDITGNIIANLISIIPPILYFAIFITMLVVTVLIVLLRFYKGLLGDEGYLMHTLPVKPWQLITSKGLVAAAVVIISSIAAILSIFILVAFDDIGSMIEGFKAFFRALGDEPKTILLIFELIIIAVVALLAKIYQIYAAMAIGQLADKYRKLISLGAYIGISIVISIIGSIILVALSTINIDMWLDRILMEMSIFGDGFGLIQAVIGIAFICAFLQLAVFHIITERLLYKKLNLI